MLASLRGYVSFAFFSIASFLLISNSFILSSHRPPAGAYENEKLYYSLSSFKRLASDNAAFDSSLAISAALASGADADLSQIAINATLLSFARTELEWNANHPAAPVHIGCIGESRMPDTVFSCAPFLAYLPPSNVSPFGHVQIIGPDAKVAIAMRDSISGNGISGHFPSGYFLGAR